MFSFTSIDYMAAIKDIMNYIAWALLIAGIMIACVELWDGFMGHEPGARKKGIFAAVIGVSIAGLIWALMAYVLPETV